MVTNRRTKPSRSASPEENAPREKPLILRLSHEAKAVVSRKVTGPSESVTKGGPMEHEATKVHSIAAGVV